MKKLLSFVMGTAILAGTLAGCSSSSSSTAASSIEGTSSTGSDSSVASTSTAAVTSGEMLQIGITQYVEHDALDASYRGFVDALADNGYVDGENITIDYQNASGDQSNTNTIASKFVNDNKDLILAIATPAAQAVANATTEIPILVTAVTDPADAKLVASNEAPGGNVTGTSDLTPVKEHMELITQLFPDAKTVGFLYDSSEDNSLFQVNMAREAAEALGLSTMDFTVSSTNDVQQVVRSMEGKVDVIYSPTDNTIANAMATVATLATEMGIPTIVGEEGMVNNGGLASYSISYYELGYQTGEMAVRILRDGATPADMPIEYLTNLTFMYNQETADALNIEIPEELKAQAA